MKHQRNTNYAATQIQKYRSLKPAILILIPQTFEDVNLTPTNSGTEFGAIKTVTILIYDAIKEIKIEIIGSAGAMDR